MKRNLNLLRKTCQSALIRAAMQPMKIKKIVPNRVLFSAYMEKQYCCNPKYISLALKKLYGDRIEIGWGFRDPQRYRYLEKEGIRVLGTKTREFARYAMTSRVICSNTYFKPSLPRRKGTFYLYTWHGGGAYKKVGKYVDMSLIERLNTRMREGKTDLYLSSSRFFSEHVLRDSFGYKGEIMEKGMPRNDILLHPPQIDEIRLIRESIGLGDGQKLCLYAPTYRKDTKVHDFGLNYERALSALKERFGGEWVMGFRSHHVSMFKDNSALTAGALDLSACDDMQELLLISDALITDYSSSIWDAALGSKKVFLFAPDLNEYRMERDFYTDIHTWPFPLAENNEELSDNIRVFDEDDYQNKIQAHLNALGCCESGEAAIAAARRIGHEMGLE